MSTNTPAVTTITTTQHIAPIKPKPTATEKAAAKAKPKTDIELITYEPAAIDIALADLDEAENTTRPEGRGDVEDIKKSFATIGQQEPIRVQRKGNRFVLAAGFRRVEAARQLGMKKINARVMTLSTEEARVQVNVTENENAKRDITAMGRLAGYSKLAAQGYSVAQIAKMVAKADDYVRDVLRLEKAAEEVREALSKPEDEPGSTTWAVARLILRFDKDEQAALLKRVGHLSVAKAREILSEIRDEKKGKKTNKSSKNTSEGEGGEGEETEAGLDPAEVAQHVAPYIATITDVVGGVRDALKRRDSETIEKLMATLEKLNAKQGKSMNRLLGEDVMVKAHKDAAKALKEAMAEKKDEKAA